MTNKLNLVPFKRVSLLEWSCRNLKMQLNHLKKSSVKKKYQNWAKPTKRNVDF